LPGRTPFEAVESYAAPIRETLSCITKAVLGYSGGVYPSPTNHNLCFVGKPVARLNGTRLSLFFSQNYSLVQTVEQTWKVQTEGYFYRLDDEHSAEILSYHWHPQVPDEPYPHMHLKKGSGIGRSELQRAHIPTGRMAIENIVLFVVRDFGVEPLREDWEQIVRTNLEIFERYRTWS
jgi:hypothetical protein